MIKFTFFLIAFASLVHRNINSINLCQLSAHPDSILSHRTCRVNSIALQWFLFHTLLARVQIIWATRDEKGGAQTEKGNKGGKHASVYNAVICSFPMIKKHKFRYCTAHKLGEIVIEMKSFHYPPELNFYGWFFLSFFFSFSNEFMGSWLHDLVHCNLILAAILRRKIAHEKKK